MTKSISQTPETLQNIKEMLLDGTIGAITLDTCIFTRAGYQLDKGNLRHLEQFKENKFHLVFSEVTIKEVIKHIVKNSEEEKTKFMNGLKGIAKFWNIDQTKEMDVVKDLLKEMEPNKLAEKRVQEFINGCGAQIIEAHNTLDVSELINRYFEVLPPFEKSRDKKAEFPDAISLLSLESWAKASNTSVLFVTNDKGCKRYCNQSRRLFAIDDLRDALKLIQERNEELVKMCSSITQKISSGKFPNLLFLIKDTISENIWSIDWLLSAQADFNFNYDQDILDIEIKEVSYSSLNGIPDLYPVDYCKGTLVVSTNISVEIKATCEFTFSVKDDFDKDMVSVGDARADVKEIIDFEILLTFLNPEENNINIIKVELVPAQLHLDFGFVRPSYRDDFLDDEYY